MATQNLQAEPTPAELDAIAIGPEQEIHGRTELPDPWRWAPLEPEEPFLAEDCFDYTYEGPP